MITHWAGLSDMFLEDGEVHTDAECRAAVGLKIYPDFTAMAQWAGASHREKNREQEIKVVSVEGIVYPCLKKKDFAHAQQPEAAVRDASQSPDISLSGNPQYSGNRTQDVPEEADMEFTSKTAAFLSVPIE